MAAAAASVALAIALPASAASGAAPGTPAAAPAKAAPAPAVPNAAARPSTMAIRYLTPSTSSGVRFAWTGRDGKEVVSPVHPHADLSTAHGPETVNEHVAVNIARRTNAPVTGLVLGREEEIRAFPGISVRGGFGLLPKGKFVTGFPDGRVVSTPASRIQVARYDAVEAREDRQARAVAAAARVPPPRVVTTHVASAEELKQFLAQHPVKR